MSLGASAARLARGMKNLRLKWEEVGDHWNDSVRDDFEKKHYDALNELSNAVLREMDQLGAVLEQALRECT
jgi:hypothetical protein